MATSRWPVEFAPVDVSAAGDTTVVVADTAGRRVKLLSYLLVAGGTTTVRWKDGAGALLSGPIPLILNSGVASPLGTPDGRWLLETAPDQGLVLNLSAPVAVGGHLSYFLEP